MLVLDYPSRFVDVFVDDFTTWLVLVYNVIQGFQRLLAVHV
jgi:hypothetical protein